MIEKRPFGRTGHDSTAIIFGGFAVEQVPQAEADRTLDVLLQYGINHIGFLTNTMQATMAELSSVLKIAPRPSTRPYAEFRFRDLEGNALDLSQTKGWEVDVDKWESAA